MSTYAEVDKLLKPVFGLMDSGSLQSSHVTNYVFQTILRAERNNSEIWARYQELIGDNHKTVTTGHQSIGQGVKRLLHRENLYRVKVNPGERSLIKSYMAFQPI